MTDGRTISVVMCTYNGAKFVAEQIESIIGQTYPIYELIIQDDHSTDGTWEVLQGYQRKYPFIKVYMNESGKGLIEISFRLFIGLQEILSLYLTKMIFGSRVN